MIKQIIIENYQPYKKAILNLDKGINIINGETDSGKSAIIRALKALINNKLSTPNYKSKWCNKGEGYNITFILDDDTKIERIRTDTENIYKLNGEELKAFGQGVPDIILDKLNIESINIQSQLDKHFILSENPSEIARYINKITNLDIIDTVLSNAEKSRKRNTKNLELFPKELEIEINKLKEYDNVDEIDSLIKNCEIMDDNVNKESLKLNQLINIVSELRQCESKLENYPNFIVIDELIQKTNEYIKNIKQTEKNIQTLISICFDIKNIESNINRFPNFDIINEMINNTKPLFDEMKNIDKLNDLSGIIKSFNQSIQSLNIINEILIDLEDRKSKIPLCPACNRPL